MNMFDLIKMKLSERKGHDGVVLIVAGLAFLMLKPIANVIALGAIFYGAWTIYTDE